MKVNNEILNRIRNIKWFENCGMNSEYSIKFSIVVAGTWKEASEYYSDPQWEDTTLEARNQLTELLSTGYKNEYSKWNSLSKEAKLFMDDEVMPLLHEIKEKKNLDQIFIDCVQWDILGSIMEDAYQNCSCRATFFSQLLSIYEGGHFPCGWEGEWPDGKLVVF